MSYRYGLQGNRVEIHIAASHWRAEAAFWEGQGRQGMHLSPNSHGTRSASFKMSQRDRAQREGGMLTCSKARCGDSPQDQAGAGSPAGLCGLSAAGLWLRGAAGSCRECRDRAERDGARSVPAQPASLPGPRRLSPQHPLEEPSPRLQGGFHPLEGISPARLFSFPQVCLTHRSAAEQYRAPAVLSPSSTRIPGGSPWCWRGWR